MEDIRIGVIGAGIMGLRVLRALRAHTAFSVVGVYDPDAGAQARVRALDPALPVFPSAAELSVQPGIEGATAPWLRGIGRRRRGRRHHRRQQLL